MTDSNVGQPAHSHHAQLVGSRHDPAVGFLAARAESSNAAIRSRVFGPEHDRLSFLHKLHILACDPSYESILWTSDGKSFKVKRMGYTRDIMNVFFDQTKFKSFQNILYRYGFKAVRRAKFSHTYGLEYDYTITHPLFTREKFDVAAMLGLMALGGKTNANCSKKCSKFPSKEGNCRGHEKTVAAVPGEAERQPRPAEGCEGHSQTNIIGHAAARRSHFHSSSTMAPNDSDDEELGDWIYKHSRTARLMSMHNLGVQFHVTPPPGDLPWPDGEERDIHVGRR